MVSTFHASRLKNGACRQKLSLESKFSTAVRAYRVMCNEMELTFKAVHAIISHLPHLLSASQDQQ